MTRVLAAALMCCAACAHCIPDSVTRAEATALAVVPTDDVVTVRSADALRAAVARLSPAPPPATGEANATTADDAPPASPTAPLDAFVAATDFANSDVVLLRAGGERASLVGQTRRGSAVTLYFTGVCSACGGGNPGSYYHAAASAAAAEAAHVLLVRVPRSASVSVHVCPTECPACPQNVP